MAFELTPSVWTAIAFLMFGLLLIFLEVFQPGFFIAVPGGALFLGGAVGIAFPRLMFASAWAWLLWPVFLGVATVANLWAYNRWAPPGTKPVTLSIDSLPGELGEVTVPVTGENMLGKVRVRGTSWSARSTGGVIPVGARVVVVRAEGVHVVVEPVPEPPAPMPPAAPA